jgi:hypothetical protein
MPTHIPTHCTATLHFLLLHLTAPHILHCNTHTTLHFLLLDLTASHTGAKAMTVENDKLLAQMDAQDREKEEIAKYRATLTFKAQPVMQGTECVCVCLCAGNIACLCV